MSTPQDLVTRYLQAFNETDARRRAGLFEEICTPDCTYVDPLAAVAGRSALSELVGAVQAQLPGVAFVLNGLVDAHHDQARFTWHAVADGRIDAVAIGFDVLVLEGARIRQVLGFLDKVPS